jgi:limonene-1,2-epoxide hydrolase
MIQYNKIEPQTVEIWNSDGYFATVNEYEFNDIRIQIKKEQAEGFYVLLDDQKYFIDKDGMLIVWLIGLFDTINDQLIELLDF